jgi:aerobic-type carbon monoxide dehydrogenase small subunit (CoxS/CutS family)
LITLTVNSNQITVEDGTTVAAALLSCGTDAFRRSVSGMPRGPLCGMGICFECRVTINGVRSEKSCNVLAAEGMEVVSGE